MYCQEKEETVPEISCCVNNPPKMQAEISSHFIAHHSVGQELEQGSQETAWLTPYDVGWDGLTGIGGSKMAHFNI